MDFSKFNVPQREAITHFQGPAMVIAGPGSGKTTVIINRILYLIQEKGVSPSNIVVITFTKAAAKEMQERFEALSPSDNKVTFATFHSLFFSILSYFFSANSSQARLATQAYSPRNQGRLSVQDNSLISRKMLEILKYYNVDQNNLENILKLISKIKNDPDSIESINFDDFNISRELLFKIIERFRADNYKEKRICFDDMAYELYRLICEKPDSLKIWINKYDFYLIDEFQDISPVQYKIIRFLCGRLDNLFVVGDDDQAIYGFRGAGTGIMLGFNQDYNNARLIELPYNYRCRPTIFEAACKVIGENKKRIKKKITAYKNKSDNPSFNIYSFENKNLELKFICEYLKKMSTDELNRTVLLFRKHADSIAVKSYLFQYGISYRLDEKEVSIENSFVFKDICAYLDFINGDESRKCFYHIMNKPDRNISREACQHIVNETDIIRYYSGDDYLCKNIKNLFSIRKYNKYSLFSKINYILYGMNYYEYVKATSNDLNKDVKIIEEIVRISKATESYKEFRRCAATIAIKPGDGVALMTYHASKGLEFDNVILMGINAGIVPYSKASSEEEIEEERRMFYVAMTRAKEKLMLTYVSGTKDNPERPSIFLKSLL